jgi:23S rRNA-/tRNA-specific pseudouridylate synthase
MRNIIADSPAMQELYDAYNKPKFVTHTTMQIQEFRARRIIPVYMANVMGVIEHTKQAVAEDLFEEIKENITYEVDDKDMTPTITASIFIGKK